MFARHCSDDLQLPPWGITVKLADGAPRLRVVHDGVVCQAAELIEAMQGRFLLLPDPSRRVYQDNWIGTGPTLEACDEDLTVLLPELWPWYVQSLFFSLMHRESAIISLHSATLAFEGRALVFIGPSKSGKSTLSWALHQQGADYFGDELTLFTRPDYHLHSWRRMLRLRPGGVQELGSPFDSPVWTELKPSDPKYAVDLDDPRDPCPQNKAIFIFMDGFSDQPVLRPIRESIAAKRLMTEIGYSSPSPEGHPKWGAIARLEIAADLVDRYPCYSLSVGKPAVTAALLLNHVRGLA